MIAFFSDMPQPKPDAVLLGGATVLEAGVGTNGAPYGFRYISSDTNGKKGREMLTTRILLEKHFGGCQAILLDFTGPEPWISEPFPDSKGVPAAVLEASACNDVHWVIWGKKTFIYLGNELELWDEEGYHGLTYGYNPKLPGRIIGPNVDAPPPPKKYSLTPRKKPF